MHAALCDQLYRTHAHAHTHERRHSQTACKINHIYYEALLFQKGAQQSVGAGQSLA